MASKRELKKDIRTITTQVIADALELAARMEKQEDQEKMLEIIVSITQAHNDLIARVNHPDGKDNPKILKAYYKKIIGDLMKSYTDAYKQMSVAV